MANLVVISLNAGKLTPQIDVRSDIAKYKSGCRILENMIPVIYGPVTRRPGTKFIANVDDDDVKSKVFPFIFSSTIAYRAEFSDEIINMYFEESAVDTDIVSPYLEADLFQLQTEQSADVMWIVHPSHKPRKLSRVSPTEFTLDEIVFDKGPFIRRNDIANDDDVTIAATGTTIATATAGGAGLGSFTITNTTDTSSLFPVNGRFYATGSTGNDDAYTVKTAAFVSPTLTITPNEAVADGTNDGEIMVDGGTVTLTASSAVFNADGDHDGALFKLTHKRLKVITKGTATGTGVIGEAIDVKGTWTAKTGGNWDAVIKIQRLEDGTNWEDVKPFVSTITNGVGSGNLLKTDLEEEDGVQLRILVSEFTSGTIEADITVNTSTQDSIFRITSTASATSATATAIIAAPENTVTKRWAEGSWSTVRGYPSAVTFFEERIGYGFTNSDQQTVWLSETGEFEDFEAGTKDADSFAITIPTANRGRWLGSLEALAIGTSGDEWRIRSTSFDEALTPTNFSTKKQTSHGSADIQIMEVNEALLFIDFVARKIREFTFVEDRQKYVSPDLLALAEDITKGGITSAAVQKNPDSIIWFTTANSPYLNSMTYEREQDVVALAQHPLGGDGIAESVAVTPSSAEDVITLTVKWGRERHIVDMQPRDWGSTTDATDSFFVDDGVVDTSGSTTITGLGHLDGVLVSLLGDGAVQASKTVSNGQIIVDKAADRMVIGRPYTYQVEPMILDVNTQAGTTRGSIKHIPELSISFFATMNARVGDGTDTFDMDWRTTESHDSPPALFTGDKVIEHDAGFSVEDKIIISGSDPLPCTVRAIIARAEKTGR